MRKGCPCLLVAFAISTVTAINRGICWEADLLSRWCVIGATHAVRGGDQQQPRDHDANDEYNAIVKPPPPASSSSSPSILGKLAGQSLALTGRAVSGTLSQSGQAAHYLLRPKHVERHELIGLWRLDQQLHHGGVQATTTVELTAQGDAIVRGGGNHPARVAGHDAALLRSPFSFSGPRRWPQHARLEFVARGTFPRRRPDDPLSPPYFYQAYLHRKIADSSVIRWRGKIYAMHAAGWRGKKTKYELVGTFTGRRRIQMQHDDFVDEEHDDEGDAALEGEETPLEVDAAFNGDGDNVDSELVSDEVEESQAAYSDHE